MSFLGGLAYLWIGCEITSFLLVTIDMPRTAELKEWWALVRICLIWGPGLLFPLLVVLALYTAWEI